MTLEQSHKDLAITAAMEAAKRIMDFYQGSYDVVRKKDDSPVTAADEAAHDIIFKALQTTGIPVLSEEGDIPDYETRKHWKSCWMVDPLDGTKEFIHGNGEFTVNIAWVCQGIPLWGVIVIPEKDMIYVGDVVFMKSQKGRVPSTMKADDITWTTLKPLKDEIESDTLRVGASRSHQNRETEAYFTELRNTYSHVEIIPRGSSLKFCLLADGEVDMYPRFSPCMEWDTAAGHAICNAVGIELIHKASGTPIRYNRPDMVHYEFMASRIAL